MISCTIAPNLAGDENGGGETPPPFRYSQYTDSRARVKQRWALSPYLRRRWRIESERAMIGAGDGVHW